jgi:hypothetical protein
MRMQYLETQLRCLGLAAGPALSWSIVHNSQFMPLRTRRQVIEHCPLAQPSAAAGEQLIDCMNRAHHVSIAYFLLGSSKLRFGGTALWIRHYKQHQLSRFLFIPSLIKFAADRHRRCLKIIEREPMLWFPCPLEPVFPDVVRPRLRASASLPFSPSKRYRTLILP